MKGKRVVPESDPVKTAAMATIGEAYEQPAADMAPMVAEYAGLQAAFEHFDFELFGDELPNLMIVLTRRSHSRGHFSPDRFAAREGDDRLHEISLNPDAFFGRTDAEVLSTLVHEMCHALQAVRGTAPKRPYHNQDFALLMKARGLCPSNTGVIGGKQTGAQMSHFIIPDGVFEHSYERLRAKGWKLNLQSAVVAGPRGGKKKNKTTFTCAYCGANAWGKQSLFNVCGACLVENHPELADIAETYRMALSGQPAITDEPAEPNHSDLNLQAAE